MNPDRLQKIALVNFGGIGDAVLFSPVICELREHLPQAHLSLFLEDRSCVIGDLLSDVQEVVPLKIQKTSKTKAFFHLIQALRGKDFDAVICTGSSPYIPIMLAATGIPIRIGYQTGTTSRLFLTQQAPLNKHQYAGKMYFSLAKTFLSHAKGSLYRPSQIILPKLQHPSPEEKAWAKRILSSQQPKILIHPGVSRVSVEKNILKTWPSTRWVELIQNLSVKAHIYLVGGPDDQQILDTILSSLPEGLENVTNLYGKTANLKQLAALIYEADLLVSVDSSPLHIATGLNKPVVAMFGPTDETKLVPDAPHFKAVKKPDLSCRPCLWDHRAESCHQPVCLDVDVQSMEREIKNLISTFY